MTIQVQAPDGSTVDFPDTAKADQIHKIMTSRFGKNDPAANDAAARTMFGGAPQASAQPSGPAPAGSSVADIAKRGFPGPDITARARTGLGLPAQVPPLPPTSSFTSDVTKKAQQHPEGLPAALAAGALPAGAAAALSSASPAVKVAIKMLLEGLGVGTGIAGVEHYLK